MARINVLWVIDHVCYDGSLHGGGRLYWNVLPAFDRSKVNVVPCMLRASQEIRRVFEDSPVPVTILDKGKLDPSTVWTLFRIIKRERIDVMHLHCYGAATFGRLASAITGVPAIIHDYDTAVYFPYPWYLTVADRLLAPLTDWAIAASPMVRDYFVSRRGLDPDRMEILFHAIPGERFVLPPNEDTRELRLRLGIPEGAVVVGTVTKLGPRRGNKYLLRAAARVLEKVPQAVFVLAYKPTIFHRAPNSRYLDRSDCEEESDVADLRELVKELGIEEGVRILESPAEVDPLISTFDLFVVPFLSAHFSSVGLLEAMAKGKAAVVTELGEPAEIVRDGVNGRLVQADDPAKLATIVVDLLGKPGELRRLGEAARLSARERSVESYARHLTGRYEELAARRGRSLSRNQRGHALVTRRRR